MAKISIPVQILLKFHEIEVDINRSIAYIITYKLNSLFPKYGCIQFECRMEMTIPECNPRIGRGDYQ